MKKIKTFLPDARVDRERDGLGFRFTCRLINCPLNGSWTFLRMFSAKANHIPGKCYDSISDCK